MSNPLVSILVPVYKVEDYIERCARSVLAQTYENLEFIFVDDATPDKSIDILRRVTEEYPQRLPNIRIVRHDHNRGLAATRNTAVACCSGEFLCHVDSDDWMEPEGIELLVREQCRSGADIVTAQAYHHTKAGIQQEKKAGWYLSKDELLIQVLQYKASPTLWRRLIKRRLYTDHDIKAHEGGSGGEDYQVFPRLLYYAAKVSGIDACIYHYDMCNQHSITNSLQDSLDSQKQGYVSVCVTADFFSYKEPHLRKLVEGLKVRHLHLRMMQNHQWKNREGYVYFRDMLTTMDKTEWRYIKWDSPAKRFIETNYALLALVTPILNRYSYCKSIAYNFLKGLR